jgi:predicted Zn-dependent protease
MKAYRVQIIADKWPSDYTVEANSWATAVARAIREWAKRFKGSRTTTLKIVATKGGQVLRGEGEAGGN